jgi:predicted Zn finger-like uncharacterized protein
MLAFRCPDCGTRLRVEERWAGRQVQCGGCGQTVRAPVETNPASRSSAASDHSSVRGRFGSDKTEMDRALTVLPADEDNTLVSVRSPRRAASSTSGRMLLPFLAGCLLVIGLGVLGFAGIGLWWYLRDQPSDSSGATPPTTKAPDGKEKAGGGEPAKNEEKGWTILFRSDNPAPWNTASNGRDYAIPLDKVPAAIRYVRLRRMDTGEALILPLSRDQLGRVSSFPDAAGSYSWNGTAKLDWNGRHLGIAQSPRHKVFAPEGLMVVAYDGWDVFEGSGFSHKCVKNDARYYCLKGQELGRTVFEIAVANRDLSDDEKRFLLTK